MIHLDLTPEEQKILAYVCGFALRLLEESDEPAEEDKTALREVLAKLMIREPARRQLLLDKETAYSIAVSMEAARMDFEADFLDWRTFRRNKPDLSISTFGPLVRVWRELLADILEEPETVVLMFHPYPKAWPTASAKLRRGLGTESPSDLREHRPAHQRHQQPPSGPTALPEPGKRGSGQQDHPRHDVDQKPGTIAMTGPPV